MSVAEVVPTVYSCLGIVFADDGDIIPTKGQVVGDVAIIVAAVSVSVGVEDC